MTVHGGPTFAEWRDGIDIRRRCRERADTKVSIRWAIQVAELAQRPIPLVSEYRTPRRQVDLFDSMHFTYHHAGLVKIPKHTFNLVAS